MGKTPVWQTRGFAQYIIPAIAGVFLVVGIVAIWRSTQYEEIPDDKKYEVVEVDRKKQAITHARNITAAYLSTTPSAAVWSKETTEERGRQWVVSGAVVVSSKSIPTKYETTLAYTQQGWQVRSVALDGVTVFKSVD